jgi:ADP-heptose:LPS heptosyltransferase
MESPRRIVVSRTDAIGDVVLTLPLCALLKQAYPHTQLVFLGRSYTLPVVACSPWVDETANWDDVAQASEAEQALFLRRIGADALLHVFPRKEIAWAAKRAGIPERIGTRSRVYHWRTCNRLVALHRRNSALHEAQLNIRLAGPLLLRTEFSLQELQSYTRLVPQVALPERAREFLQQFQHQRVVVLHPKSRGSAREWPLQHYTRLLHLAQTHWPDQVQFAVTGTAAEADAIRPWLNALTTNATDLTGVFSLPEFIAFLGSAQGLVAASTGPLHLAAGLGIVAVGVYPPIRPIHAGRWSPLGPHAQALSVINPTCRQCTRGNAACTCMALVTPEQVLNALNEKLFVD